MWDGHVHTAVFKIDDQRGNEDGGGIGREDHFLPHKFIERSFEH